MKKMILDEFVCQKLGLVWSSTGKPGKKREKVYLYTENADLIIFETEKMDLRSRL